MQKAILQNWEINFMINMEIMIWKLSADLGVREIRTNQFLSYNSLIEKLLPALFLLGRTMLQDCKIIKSFLRREIKVLLIKTKGFKQIFIRYTLR